jgi:hypothetical protein
LEDKTAAIQSFHCPTTVKELQGFLGMMNFYSCFLPGAARTPLTEALRGMRAGGEGQRHHWLVGSHGEGVLGGEGRLVAAGTQAHPSLTAELGLEMDAASSHVGPALQQRRRARQPGSHLGFFSRKINFVQSKYSTFDWELWAAFSRIGLPLYAGGAAFHSIH